MLLLKHPRIIRLWREEPSLTFYANLFLGEVLQVDTKNDLVEVETYLKEEGILVTNWFPISFLKKPAETKRRGLKLETQVHTNLVRAPLYTELY